MPVEEKKKKKTKGGKGGVAEEEEEGEDAWSQDQQKALEVALAEFPKVIYIAIGMYYYYALHTSLKTVLSMTFLS